jgi:hypothetical protein
VAVLVVPLEVVTTTTTRSLERISRSITPLLATFCY